MADDHVQQCLVKWGLENLLESFKENGIDEQTFKELTKDLLRELIPQIGPRIKFLRQWTEYIKNTECLSSTTEQHNSTVDSVQTCSSDSEDSDEQNEPNNHQLRQQRSFVANSTFRMIARPQVEEILESCLQGRAILKSYKKDNTLTRESRALLADIIITEILKDQKTQLKNEDFDYISKDILRVFPTELRSTYYIPPVKKQFAKSHKPVTSRGKLVDKYRNKLRQYRRLSGDGLAPGSSASTSTSANDDEAEVPPDTQEMLSWLEKNQEPWELVISHWRSTSSFRMNKIKNYKEKNLVQIFKQWPLLRHPLGYTLLEEDFAYLNVGELQNAIDNWHIFFGKLKEVCPPKKDKVGLELIKLLQTEGLSDDSKSAVQFSVLPYLIPPKGRVRTKTNHWKPSMNECQESLLMHAKIPGDVSRIQEIRENCMANLGLTVQPYIIVVGSSLEAITTIYVSIDKVLYKVPSVRKAIDTCFKSFYALHLLYPPESEHIWYLIQVGLYKVSAKYDKKISYVLEILSSLNAKS